MLPSYAPKAEQERLPPRNPPALSRSLRSRRTTLRSLDRWC
jgi:hypothetical protein